MREGIGVGSTRRPTRPVDVLGPSGVYPGEKGWSGVRDEEVEGVTETVEKDRGRSATVRGTDRNILDSITGLWSIQLKLYTFFLPCFNLLNEIP